jgi:hypothetical protein
MEGSHSIVPTQGGTLLIPPVAVEIFLGFPEKAAYAAIGSVAERRVKPGLNG